MGQYMILRSVNDIKSINIKILILANFFRYFLKLYIFFETKLACLIGPNP